MYYPDLSHYEYIKEQSNSGVLNVGWLDKEHTFAKGKVSEEVLHKLLKLCFIPINQTRGFHISPFAKGRFGYPVKLDGKSMLLGSAEIRVPGRGGTTYAAPNLIYHYIQDCSYLPPKEFIKAVEDMQIE